MRCCRLFGRATLLDTNAATAMLGGGVLSYVARASLSLYSLSPTLDYVIHICLRPFLPQLRLLNSHTRSNANPHIPSAQPRARLESGERERRQRS